MQPDGGGRLRVRAPALRRAESAAERDQRLGGAADVASLRLPLPAGFAAEPVAAGLTAPLSVAAAADGLLYVAEAGHPRRTPPRLLRLDPQTGVASVVAAFESLPAPGELCLAASGEALYLAAAGTIWRVDPAAAAVLPHTSTAGGRAAPSPALVGGLLVGATVSQGALWLCDPGRPAGAPGVGLLWRVTLPGAEADVPVAPPLAVIVRHRRTAGAIVAGGAVAVAALALVWLYRERRSERRRRTVT